MVYMPSSFLSTVVVSWCAGAYHLSTALQGFSRSSKMSLDTLWAFPSHTDGPLGPRGLVEATEMCTQECLVLGHSDNCWMPPALGTYQQPKSPVSSFGSQREWGPKDKLLNGHTLTRTWKNESGRSENFGDRKQFGSGEGHFASSGMADIPLVSLKSCQPTSCPDSPKDQQL
ncbi:hypothetical protein PAMP_000368 [Pampus punctatissimus]